MSVLTKIVRRLPPEIAERLSDLGDDVTELRIRRGRRLSLTRFNGRGGTGSVFINQEIDFIVNDSLMDKTLDGLCSHSLYSHMETMNEGYLALPDGYRVGVAGRAVEEEGKIKHLSEITSLNIRIPRDVPGVAGELYERLSRSGFSKSVLLFSPPNMGKTTILRDIILRLASPPAARKVALIDTRREIETSRLSLCPNLDILSGYPKGKGIEIATRTLSPEYIVCDEIGGTEEAIPLLSAQNCGVPIIATAHASGVHELLLRKNIALLHEARLFTEYIGIRRLRPGEAPTFSITSCDEIGKGMQGRSC